jgi:hypothetical protein
LRTTLEIIIAVKDRQPVTARELELALLAMSGIERFEMQALLGLIKAVRDSSPDVKTTAELAWGTADRMWNAAKKPPDEWLGPGNIPGTPEQAERLRWGKAVYRAATGEEL